MSIQEISIIAGLSITAVAAIFSIYDRFSKPDIKSENDIAVLKEGCRLKHEGIDKDISFINKDLTLIKENHLRHIEADVNDIKLTQKQILTILEAKYQVKI